ncbi:hypothetical protein [Falsiporphyromonas endometrii]|uniref:Outer membrane protein beta-barrel domain-containing protein n=1 Tax=Falsiporphyromonas endometrii TaxID=1387297 RepID=A0ABV9K4K7_9PORP
MSNPIAEMLHGMFKYYTFLFFLLVIVQNVEAQTDSIKTEKLPEVVITADGQIEMSNKTLLLPTQLEKKHSANGFNLLSLMQTPGLVVSARTRSITTYSGGDVVLCINGMEVMPEDVASLSAKNIRTIEYIKTPSGKYAGKAGLVNFVTVKMDYAGNVYLSANNGLAYKMGEYLAFADFNKKRYTFSLTATGDWHRDHSYREGNDMFVFSDKSVLKRNYRDDNPLEKNNGQAMRLRLTSIGNSYRLNTYVDFTRQATPDCNTIENISYTDPYGASKRMVSSSSQSIAPSAYVNYTLWMPKEQTFDITASASIGHNKYHSLYMETEQNPLSSKVTEDNYVLIGNARYSKTWENGFAITGTLSNDYKHYTDDYDGTAQGKQQLTSNVTLGLLQLSKYSEKYYYYVSAGLSNTAVSLNSVHNNYCMPVAFYGGNYALNSKHSLSLNGLFTHSLFEPSEKNSMVIPTSFFEATCGNPDIAPMKLLGNTLSYNGQAGKVLFSLSYDSSIYFDNIVHQYTADTNTIFDTRINGGTFCGNMFTLSCTYNLLNERLRLSATAIEECNRLKGSAYDMSYNSFRIKGGLVYLAGEWMFSFDYLSPYKSLDIRQPWLIQHRPTYEWVANWTHKALTIELLVRNPFSRYDKQHIMMNYGCYDRNSWNFNETNGRSINLTLAYRFSYGKKSECGEIEVNKNIDSAIMKMY